jgi:Ala-tRNA(Pro) deacylase
MSADRYTALIELLERNKASYRVIDHAPEVGTVLPLPFDARLELIVDPSLLTQPEIFFNAARLDRSVALSAGDFRRIAGPRLERIGAVQ